MTDASEKLVDEFERAALERYSALQRSGARITVGIAEDVRYQAARNALLSGLGVEQPAPVAEPKGVTEPKPVCQTCRGTGTAVRVSGRITDCPICNGRGWIAGPASGEPK